MKVQSHPRDSFCLAEAAGSPGTFLQPVRPTGGLQAHRLDLQPAGGVGGGHSATHQRQHLHLRYSESLNYAQTK